MSLPPSTVVSASPTVEPYPSEASPPPSPKYRAVYPEVIQGLDFIIIENPPPVLYAPSPLSEDGSSLPCEFLRRDLPTTMDDAKPGHDVKVHGLQGDVEHLEGYFPGTWSTGLRDGAYLNGTTGTLVKYLNQKACWRVRACNMQIVEVGSDNLEPLTVNNNHPSWNDLIGFGGGGKSDVLVLVARLRVLARVPLRYRVLARVPLRYWSKRVRNWAVAFNSLCIFYFYFLWEIAKAAAVLPAPSSSSSSISAVPLSPSTEPHPSEESTPPPPSPQHKEREQGGSGGEQQDELPEGVRLHILNFLSNEDKMTISKFGQQPYRDCHVSNGLERPIVTTLTFRPVQRYQQTLWNRMDDGRRGIRLLQQLRDHQEHDARKKQTMQGYHRIKVENVHQFGTVGATFTDLVELAQNTTMMGVTNLDISVATQQTVSVAHYFVETLLVMMLPNLRVLDLTNIAYDEGIIKVPLAVTCPSLEKIVWNNGRNDTLLWEEGFEKVLHNSIAAEGDILEDCQNMTEIEMNNFRFLFIVDLDAWSNDPNKFLFHNCSTKKLERVSIKNATAPTAFGTGTDIRFLQAMLVKFVRKVPSLRYFSSDLTKDNIAMLQQERSDIVFE